MTSVLEDVRAKVARGTPISVDDAKALLASHDLVRLGMLGDEARRRRHGDRATYVRVADVPWNAIPASLPAAAGEVRLGGTPASAEQAIAAARETVALARGTPVSAYSLADLHLMTGGGRQLRALASDLFASGIAAVAEAPIDVLADAPGAVQAVLDAGGVVARFTCQGTAPVAPIDLLKTARLLHRATGAVRVFAPLPRGVDGTAPTTGFDDIRLVAVARLFLDEIATIQVDWSLYGPKLAQVALLFGVDDVDSVSPVDDAGEGRRRAPLEEIHRNIRAAALVPVERDGRFAVRES